MYKLIGKRIVDVMLASMAIVTLSPLLALVSLAVYADDRGRVLFRQMRVGRDGRQFKLLKFRSMRENVGDLPSHRATELPVTRVGRYIRRTNIDELPQLWNILKGDMSIVGPRPPLPSQIQLIELRTQSGAISCRPGLTGEAQVKAYNGMPVTEKARLDAEYAQSMTLVHDAWLVLCTVGYLFRRPPVY